MAWKRGAGEWTYTGNPADSDKDMVRFLSGDVHDDAPQVSNEEIAAMLTLEGNATAAAAAICEHLASTYAREAQQSVSSGGGLNTSVSLSEKSRAYAIRAKDLRARATARGAMVYAGGITVASVDANNADTDLIQPELQRDTFTNA